VHETLVEIRTDGEPAPSLAKEWAAAAGGREWTLALEDGLRFHDGRPVGAEDAARALGRFLRGGSAAAIALGQALEGGGSHAASETDALAGIVVGDSTHLTLRLRAPLARPLVPLASPAAAIEGSGGAGAGPFVPSGPPARSLRLTAFAAHVRGRPLLDGVRVMEMPDAPARAAALRAGRVHLVPGRPGPAHPAAVLLLVLDPASPPFDQPAVRAAVAERIPRADLARYFVPGGEPAGALLLSLPTVPSPAATGPPLPATPFGLAVSREVAPLASQRVVAYLDAIGLRPSVSALAPREARARGGARLLLFVPEVPEAELTLRELASLAPPPSAVHEMLDLAALEMDAERREGLLRQAEAVLREAHVLVPLAAAPVAFQADPRLHDARVDARGRLLLEDAWLEP
jgi:MarR-like DNA-binding transcriptional regulator SgrR of sgrS sRNA